MLRSAVPLALLLVLQLSGSDGGISYQTVIEEDDVTLSCENVLPDQNQCELTDWFIGNDPVKKDHAVSSSVSLLQNCSMVLHRVTTKQAGEYFTCRQNKREKSKTEFQLFVASLSQEQKDDTATLTCSVTPEQCSHEVKWLNNGEEVTVDHKELQMSHSPSGCSASVSVKHQFPPSPFYQTLKCEVKQRNPVQIFTLFPQAPQDDKTPTKPPRPVSSSAGISVRPPLTSLSIKTSPERSLNTKQTSSSTKMTYLLLKVAVPVVIAAALILAFVALMLWGKCRGSGDANGETVNPEDGVTYASVQINQKKTKTRKSLQSRDGEEDVTYSSVNVPGQRKTGDPEDNVTYVSVNFNNKKKKKKSDKSGSRAEDEDVTYSSVNVAAAAGPDSRLYSSVHKPK